MRHVITQSLSADDFLARQLNLFASYLIKSLLQLLFVKSLPILSYLSIALFLIQLIVNCRYRRVAILSAAT